MLPYTIQAREAERSFKRPNKHRPHEASSKKPVPRLREVIQPLHRCVRAAGGRAAWCGLCSRQAFGQEASPAVSALPARAVQDVTVGARCRPTPARLGVRFWQGPVATS